MTVATNVVVRLEVTAVAEQKYGKGATLGAIALETHLALSGDITVQQHICPLHCLSAVRKFLNGMGYAVTPIWR